MKKSSYDGIVVAVAAVLSFAHPARAASDTWNDPAGTLWQLPASWLSGSQFPGLNTSVYTSPDDAAFGAIGAAGTIDLGNTINIRSLIFGVSGGDAAAFSIGDSNDILNFTSGGGITINAGVTTAQTIGTTGMAINLSTVNSASTTFTNNGTGLLTIAANIVANVGSGDGVLMVGGSGNTAISGTITRTGNNALLKTGTGTLTLSNGSTWRGGGAAGFPITTREGTLLLNGGTHTVDGELVIGGVVTNGGAGQNAKIQIDAGALNVINGNYFSLGRGNGVGGVSSDLVANNDATISVPNFSGGFNGGDGRNLPKGSVTLNNTSTFTTSGVFNLGESAGSDMTFTLNGSSQLLANGGGNFIGNGGNGTLVLNGTSSATFRSEDTFLGRFGSSVGKVTVNGGTFNYATATERWLFLGGDNTSRGQIDLISGSMNMLNNAKIRMGNGNSTAANVINQTGGALTFYSNGGANPTVGGGGLLDMQWTDSSNANNTYNLNGGTLTVPTIISTRTNGTRAFNFNGGTLKASVAGVLMNLGGGNARANVRNGGAIIDTNGLGVSISQPLLHSNIAPDSAVDGGLTKSGSGTLTLSGASTYTGATSVNAGTLKAGVASVAGTSGAFGNNSAVTMANAAGVMLDITGFNTQIGSLAGGGTTGGGVTLGSATLTAGGNGASTSYAGVINGIGGGLTKTGTGTLTLTNANTYTGPTAINAGTLQLGGTGSIFNMAGLLFGGSTGALQLGDASGIKNLALTSAIPGTVGTNAILGGAAANSIITLNGAGAQTYLNSFGKTAVTNGNNLNLIIAGTGTAATSILVGTSTYTGTTTINSGSTLDLSSGALGNTAVTVGSGSALTGTGNISNKGVIGGTVTAAGGSTVVLGATNGTALRVDGGITLGDATNNYGMGNYTTLRYTLGAGNAVGQFNTPGILTLNTGGAFVDITNPTQLGSYTLANFASHTGSGTFSLSSTAPGILTQNVGRNTETLTVNATSLLLDVAGVANPNVAYFNGAVSNVWNDLSNANLVNFSTNKQGTADALNIPGAVTDVVLNSDLITSASTQTLGANTTINSLNVNGNGTTTLAADGSTLTIVGAADNNTDTGGGYTGNAAGNGISIASNANTFTVNTPLVVGTSGANQSWTNASANTFTVGGTVTGSASVGNTQTLTLANTAAGATTLNAAIADSVAGKLAITVNNTGSGLTTFGTTNTFSGGTTLNGGVLTSTVSGGFGTGDVTVNPTNVTGTAADNATLNTSGSIAATTAVTVNSQTGNGGFGVGTINFNSAAPTIGSLAGNGNVVLNNAGGTALTVGSTNNLSSTFSGVISNGAGTGSLVKAGNGMLTLNGVNTYTGTTTLNAGTLIINSASTSSSEAILNAGTLVLNGANSFTGGTTINGGILQVGNVNALGTTSAALTFGVGSTGKLQLNGNSIALTDLNTNANVGAPIIESGFGTAGTDTLTVNTANTSTFAGVLQNGGTRLLGVTKSGTGTLTLSGTNTFTGGLLITNGAVSLSNNQALGGTNGETGAITLNGGTLRYTNTSALTNTHPITVNGSGSLDILGTATGSQGSRVITGSNTLFGSGALTINGNGTINAAGGSGALVITDSNNGAGSYNGNITLQNGAILANEASANGLNSAATVTLANNSEFSTRNTSSNNVTVSGGTNSFLGFNNGNSGIFSGNVMLNANATIGLRDWYNYGNVHSGTISGLVTGTGGLSINSGTGSGGVLTLSNAANNYSGAMNISASTLKAGSTGAFSATSAIVFANVANTNLDTTGFNTTVGSLAGGGTTGGNVTLGAATLTTGGDGTSTSYNGIISGTGGLTKIGNGTQSLTGTSSYTGTTVVTSGTLLAGSSKALGNTTTVNINGGNLDVLGSAAGSLTLGTSAALSLSSGSISLQLGTVFDKIISSDSGSFTITGGTLALNLGAGFDYANQYTVFSDFGGVNTITNLSFSGYDSTNYSARLSDSGTISFESATPVPEPSTWVGAGLITGLAAWSQRRRLRRGRIVRRLDLSHP